MVKIYIFINVRGGRGWYGGCLIVILFLQTFPRFLDNNFFWQLLIGAKLIITIHRQGNADDKSVNRPPPPLKGKGEKS